MNDTMSLVLATTILALGGVGLFVFKNSSDDQEGGNYNEDNWFGSNFFNSSNENESEEHENKEQDEEYNEEEDYKPKSRRNNIKTKRNRKSGGTKRRY